MANYEVMTRWYEIGDRDAIKELCNILKPVDIVEIKTSPIQVAICSKGGENPRIFIVSHVQSESVQKYIKNISLFELPEGSEIRINNTGDNVYCRAFIAKDYGLNFGKIWERQRESRDSLDINHCSEWFYETGLPQFNQIVREGDMVEFRRFKLYSHWAICIQQPQPDEDTTILAHRSGSGGILDVLGKMLTGKIIRSSIKDVINGCKFRINNSWDSIYSHRIFEEEIVTFALKSIENKSLGNYDVLSNNCWNFVMQARYNINIRDHIELRSNWFTNSEEFIPLLYVGDIIRLQVSSRREDLAIYIGNEMVAHLSPSGLAGDNVNVKVCESTMDDFFTTVAQGAKFRIDNYFDHIWEPKTSDIVVDYVRNSIGKKNIFFVVGARYGQTVRDDIAEKAQTLSGLFPAMDRAYREHRHIQNSRWLNP